MASRTGIAKDAQAIDYQATLNCLEAGTCVKARHFVLLSAFCLRNPQLQFQHAKLRFEQQLQQQHAMTWSIVRPTAYFKSVSSQVEVVAYDEAPYVMFGNGEGMYVLVDIFVVYVCATPLAIWLLFHGTDIPILIGFFFCS